MAQVARFWLCISRGQNSGARSATISEEVCVVGMDKPDLVQETIEAWQPRSPRALGGEDARQICQNVVGFFEILSEWDRASEEQEQREDLGSGLSPATAADTSTDRVMATQGRHAAEGTDH